MIAAAPVGIEHNQRYPGLSSGDSRGTLPKRCPRRYGDSASCDGLLAFHTIGFVRGDHCHIRRNRYILYCDPISSI